MRRSAWIPIRLLVTLLLRYRHHGRRTDKCWVGHHPLQPLMDGLGVEGNRETLKLFVCRRSSPSREHRVHLLGDPVELWSTVDKIQRLLIYGCRLEDVVTDLRRGILLPSVCASLNSSTGRVSGTREKIEGSGVSESRLSSRYRSPRAWQIVLFCVAWPHAPMVSLWSSSRLVCARRVAKSL